METRETTTPWEDVPTPSYPELAQDMAADVVVVGGGLCGVLTTYLLAKAGKRVALLEAEKLGANASKRTTAFITQDIDTDLTQLISLFGPRKARLVWESGGAAINDIQQIVETEGIDCEFTRCSAFVYAREEKELKGFEKEVLAANKLGFANVSMGTGDLGFRHAGFIEEKDQAKFHPFKFLHGVAQAAQRHGAVIFENSNVHGFDASPRMRAAQINGKRVLATDIVIATYDPLTHKGTKFKKGMYISYVLEARMERGLLKEGIYWDDASPYHYFRVDHRDDHDRVIFGGEDHRAEIPMDPEKNFAALQQHFEELFPKRTYTIVRRWTGPILEPSDGLPLIGRLGAHVYLASAFSGNGMTYSMIAARILSDQILGIKNAWAAVYDPRRTPSIRQLTSKGRDYINVLFGGAVRNVFKRV